MLKAIPVAAVVVLAVASQAPLKYPEARKGDVVDTYGTTKVPDPYRWMEDLDAPDVAAWVRRRTRSPRGYLASLPLRDAFKTRITELWDYPRTSHPGRSRAGGCSIAGTAGCSGSRRSTCGPG